MVKCQHSYQLAKGDARNDDRMPRLIRDPRQDPLDQNPYAALADDSDNEVPDVDVSHLDSPNGTEGKETRTYASVASSSSGSGDADDQPNYTKLTKLPDTGMRQH